MTDIFNLEALPYELFEQISEYIKDSDMLDLCRTNENILERCDTNFWAHRALSKGYIKNIDEFGERKAQERYIQLLSEVDCVPGSEKYVKNWLFICPYRAAFRGDIKTLNYFLDKKYNIDLAIVRGAAEGGHIKIVKYFLTKNHNDEDLCIPSLCGASRGGHVDIVDYILNIVDNDEMYFVYIVFINSVREGQLNIVKYLVRKKAYYEHGIDLMDEMMCSAIEKGHIDIVKYLIKKYNCDEEFLNAVAGFAATKDKIEILKYLIEKGATELNYIRMSALQQKNTEIMEYLDALIEN